jgi:hypothetical protein
MTIPASRFLRVPRRRHGPDVVVRDRRRRLHAVVLTAHASGLEAGTIASNVAAATPLPPAGRLVPLTVHVYSLPTGMRRAFVRDTRRDSTLVQGPRVA